MTVTKAFSHREKTEYLAVILRSIMAVGHRVPYVSPLGTPLFAAGSGQELVERFRLITTPGKKLAGWCIAICITFYVLLLAGSYFFVFQPTSYVLVDRQNAFPNSRIWELLALLVCGGCWYSGIRIEKKGVGETVMFLLTEIQYRLSRALGKAVILVLAAVMLVISMGAYMGNLQAQQTMLDHLADSIPVTARVMNRAGTQSTRIFIDTERYDVLTSLNVHDIRCTAGAAGGVAGKFVQAGHEPGGDMMMRAANCVKAIPALSIDRMAYGDEYGPGFLSSNQAACGISEPYAQKMGVRLGDYMILPVYTLTYYSSGEEYTYIGDHALQVAAIYPYNEVNGERTPDMVVPAAWLRTSAERAGEPFYYSSLSVNLDDPLHLTRFKETLINLGFVQAGNSSGFGTCDAISVEDELFIKTAEDLRETLKIYRGFQVPFFGLVTGTVMLTVFLVLRSSRKDIAIASSIGEGRLRISFVHFSSTVLTQMLGGMLASAILVAYVGITVSDSLWILSVYLLCASVGTMLAILQLMRFDTLSLLTQRN
ncbi:hypothetical protein [Acutalibacter caecimuris]|uniref:hypothetical protein n=1 Tax=Acutalibacter caecimuris TaxID=3093657 RepID=UPI002AC99AC8|nr:hypothetical protein [Acutalibacter sp. M00118]